jgi:actin-like ATPase involved in cell morphogenesis
VLGKKIGIDLGTSTVLIYVKGVSPIALPPGSAMGTGIPALIADDPQTSVVRGTGLALEHFEVLRRNQSYLR